MEQQDCRRIVEQYADMVLQIAYQNLKNRADAEEITQEVFLRLITSAPVFAGEEHQKAWLIRVTINLCKNHLKTVWNRRTTTLDETCFPMEEDQRELLCAVCELPAKFRNVIYLQVYQGYSVAEIAQILGRSKNTVGSWLYRGRAKLKQQLKGGCEDE